VKRITSVLAIVLLLGVVSAPTFAQQRAKPAPEGPDVARQQEAKPAPEGPDVAKTKKSKTASAKSRVPPKGTEGPDVAKQQEAKPAPEGPDVQKKP
jgi:hypothetical protein